MGAVLFREVLVFDDGAPDGVTGPLDVLVEGNRIAAVGSAAAPAGARVVEGEGRHLLLPGLVNAHFHSPVNHLKGSLPSYPLELFMLYESPPLEGLRPTPREAYLRTMLAAMEMLRRGTTAVQDDAFFMPEPEPRIIDAVMRAYADSGIRATVALDQPQLAEADKLPFILDGADGELRAMLEAPGPTPPAQLLEAYRHLIGTWHGAAGGRLRAAVSVSAPQRVSPEYWADLDALSREHGIPLFAHMLETKVQRVLGDRHPRFGGRSLVRYTADLGLLNERTNVIHAIWVTGEDLDLVADAGAVIAHNPISNLRLGSGVMPWRAAMDRGIPICLGTDEAVADDAVNMWAVAKATGLVHNVTGLPHERWPSAAEVLGCLWRGGARAMGLQDDLGAVAPGRLADLTLVDLHTLPFTPLNDVRRQLVYCHDGESVRMTMVDGEVVAEDGRLTRVDEDAVLAETRELFAELREPRARAIAEAERWFPHYRAMLARAHETEVGMNRWVAL